MKIFPTTIPQITTSPNQQEDQRTTERSSLHLGKTKATKLTVSIMAVRSKASLLKTQLETRTFRINTHTNFKQS